MNVFKKTKVPLLSVFVCLCALQAVKTATIRPAGSDGNTETENTVPGQQPRSCSVCAPGYGVTALCNGTHDTVCSECLPGTYNNEYTVDKPCRPCNSCPDGYYERTPCINLQDVNCAMCTKNGGGFGNEDFLRKCETTTTSTTTTTTTAPSTVSQTRPTLPPGVPKQHKTTAKPIKSKTTTTPAPIVKVVTSTTESQKKTTPPQPKAATTSEQRLKPLPPLKGQGDEDVTMATGGGVLAAGAGDEPKVGAATGVETGGFQWSIFIAAVVAAIVFFVLGILVSMCVGKPNTKAKPEYALDYGDPPGDDTVDASPNVTMISKRPLEGAVAYEDYDNPSTPMYTGKH